MKTRSHKELLDKVRKTLKGLQDSSQRTSGMWKPTGEHTVRIVSYKHAEYPFIELFFHYGIDNKNYISPKSFGNPDPFEKFADKLAATGDKNDYALSRTLRAKMRIFVPVLVRSEEDEGIRFWQFGKTTYEEILKIMSDPDYGDISDINNGTDLVITYQTPEEAGNNFGKTSIRTKRNTSPLSDSEELIKKYLDEQKNINDIYKELEYDELKDILENWLKNKNSKEEKEISNNSNDEEEVKNEDVDKASAAFDKL